MKFLKYLYLIILSMVLTGCTAWGGTTLPETYTLNLYENETELYQSIEVSAIERIELPMYTTSDTKVYVGWQDDSSTYIGQLELTSDLDLYLVEENVEDVFGILELVNGLVIKSYTGNAKQLKIPMYINDQQVRFIGNKAFEHSDLVEVMIPESVSSISAGAFWYSNDLEKISFYGEIESISKDLYSSDKFIELMDEFSDECTVINTEDGITYYSDTCPILSSEKTGEIVINDVEYYSVYVEKQDVYFYDSYTHQFAAFAFANLPSLTSFEMPYGWTEFENSFYNTPLLTDVSFPKSDFYKVVDQVVYSADELELIYYPSGLTSTNFDIPEQVEEIGAFAFSHTEYLETLKLSSSLDALSPNSFNYAYSLKAIDASLNTNDFYSVDGVLYRYNDQSELSSMLILYPLNKVETTFSIPEGITRIYDNAFLGNKILENVIIPSTCLRISQSAFSDTEHIKSITIPSSVEFIEGSAFRNSYIETFIFERSITDGDITSLYYLPQTLYSDYVVYVPDDSVDEYREMVNVMSVMPAYIYDRVRPVSEYSPE